MRVFVKCLNYERRSMGLAGTKLLEYVEARRERENKKRAEDLGRDHWRLTRDDKPS